MSKSDLLKKYIGKEIRKMKRLFNHYRVVFFNEYNSIIQTVTCYKEDLEQLKNDDTKVIIEIKKISIL